MEARKQVLAAEGETNRDRGHALVMVNSLAEREHAGVGKTQVAVRGGTAPEPAGYDVLTTEWS